MQHIPEASTPAVEASCLIHKYVVLFTAIRYNGTSAYLQSPVRPTRLSTEGGYCLRTGIATIIPKIILEVIFVRRFSNEALCTSLPL
ncbi:hypothetical protein PILCRDRAFT_826684 [Piloderma croceum F 1598]|uniref:Uncharacterized protein n=1 Tax=Piloderma croceum (strain F 1598) TaxID=765440 RepID=A0A0C3BFE3_PILCF|nr:hypothetical protein PILCRDRAFT_826684 [Piloderma croceum F 1598]